MPATARERITSYPSPKLVDRIFYEVHTTRDSIPAVGTAHPDTVRFSGFKFTKAAAQDDGEDFVRWFYVNNRTDEKDYNYVQEYPWGDKDYPRLTRSYIVLRENYASIATGTVDPVNSALSLIDQVQRRLDDPVLDALFVEHIRVFERLPGVSITEKDTEEETGAAMITYRQRVAPTTEPDAEGSTISSKVVIKSVVRQLSSGVAEKITVTMAVPGSRVEYESIGYQFPAIFDFVAGWTLPAETGAGTRWPYQPPYPGDEADCNYKLEAHRTASKPAEVTISYSNGAPTVTEETFMVETPARASRVFPIGENTIHDAITITMSADAETQTVEDFAASVPSSYTKGDTLTIRAAARRWRGPIWEKKVTTIEE